MKISLATCLLFLTSWSFGYDLEKNYNWEPVFSADSYSELINHEEEATVVFDKSLYYYYVGSTNKKLMLKHFEHRLIWIEDESAIEKLNEVYLPSSASGFKARIINSDGKVVNFDESRIEEISTDEGSSSYQKLALPGIEPKSWVEVYYVMDNINRSERITLDDQFRVISAQVVVQEPKNWGGTFRVKIKGYNGYEDAELEKSESSYVYEANNIAAVGKESYAHEYMDSPRCDFTIVPGSWKGWSHIVYQNINPTRFKSYAGATNKMLKEIGADEGTVVEKIRKIEFFIKENITRTEQDGVQFDSNIGKILKSKIASESGIVSTFLFMLHYAEIPFEIYLAADEDYIDLEMKMPSSKGLSDFIIYFPKEDLYLLPNSKYFYLGRIPNHVGGMNALRVVQSYSTAPYYLKRLPKGQREYNMEKTSSLIQLNLDEEECLIKLKKSYYGDRAIRSRGYMNFCDASEKKEYTDGILLSGMETTELNKFEVINDDIALNFISKDTLHFIGELTSDEVAITVSNGFLLNLSKVMGSQSSFYEEGERQRRINIETSRVYEHEIRFVIPEGYKLENIENYRFDESYTPKGAEDPVAAFESKAQIADGVLLLYVYEIYEEGMYPKEDLEEYKSVINAAYEFYIAKVMLVKE